MRWKRKMEIEPEAEALKTKLTRTLSETKLPMGEETERGNNYIKHPFLINEVYLSRFSIFTLQSSRAWAGEVNTVKLDHSSVLLLNTPP
jgi:hypothetical protein